MTTKKIVKGNTKSKRVTTHSRQVINKRVKQHKRKMKKEATKLHKAGIKRRTKRGGQNADLPNMMPLKRQLIRAMAGKKSDKGREATILKLESKTAADINLSVITEDPAVREEKYLNNLEKNALKTGPKKTKNYMKELKEVIESSDIILEVLDARDPEGCRCREYEAQVLERSGDKKIILVLNKIDLVPIEVVQAWKKQLSREYATVLFKANTQGQSSNLGSVKLFNNVLKDKQELVNTILNSSKSVGPEKLMEIIKNYSKTEGVKKAVTVGVIGFPNVGKSSLINSMKKRRATAVSSIAGYTKNLQEVEIDSKVKIIDSPGVILSKEDEVTLVLRNQINAVEVKDPITPIERIMDLIKKEELLIHYKIPDFDNAKTFLLHVAKARGKFIKGGIPDFEAAARVVISDWSSGKLKYYSTPAGYNSDANGMSMEDVNELHQELIEINKEDAMLTE